MRKVSFGLVCAAGGATLVSTLWCGSQTLRFSAASSAANGASVSVASAAPKVFLKVPAGFRVAVFAENLNDIGMMAATENGCIYICRPDSGEVTLLRPKKDGTADAVCAASGLDRPQGICLHGNRAYLYANREVLAANRRADGTLGPFETLAHDLPPSIPDAPDHALAFSVDGWLYGSVAATESDRGGLWRMRPSGSEKMLFATGLRNTTAFGWNPDTAALWGMDSSAGEKRDIPEELNRIEAGKNYGWPACYANHQPNVSAAHSVTTAASDTSEIPCLLYSAHSGATALAFYDQRAFPAECWSDAFVTFAGDTDKGANGKVARIRFRCGKPVGMEDFMTATRGPKGAETFRPSGIIVAPDGSLLIADAATGCVYRVASQKP